MKKPMPGNYSLRMCVDNQISSKFFPAKLEGVSWNNNNTWDFIFSVQPGQRVRILLESNLESESFVIGSYEWITGMENSEIFQPLDTMVEFPVTCFSIPKKVDFSNIHHVTVSCMHPFFFGPGFER
jgi:hypothetical protein